MEKIKKTTLFHPLELAFCGFSNSGKTTLISKLLESFTHDYQVGYVKSDAHYFEMDKEGKDTWKANQAGASQVFINDHNKEALLKNQRGYSLFNPLMFQNEDFVFIEGYKNHPISKFVFIDDKGEIFERLSDLHHIVGLIYDDINKLKLIPDELSEVECFSRDDHEGLTRKIQKFLDDQVKLPLYGLILTGGKSTRMGVDKFSLSYKSDQPHYQYLYNLLEKFCDKSFISCRDEQQSTFEGHPTIVDSFKGLGPTSGILSAMQAHPNVRWLVLACDLPLVNEAAVERLVSESDPYKVATAYLNEKASRLEPLCTIYSPRAYSRFLCMIGLHKFCPQKLLWNSNIKKIKLEKEELLSNANTPEDYKRFKGVSQEVHSES